MNSLTRWDPFRDLEDFQERLGGFFGRRSPAGTLPTRADEFYTQAQWAPAVDISEDDKGYHFKAELPEVRRDDIKVKVENGILTLSGERKLEKEEKSKKYHRIERQYGSFVRSFGLPDQVDPSQVVAEFSHGVLNVHVPKSESAKPRLVDVKVN